MKATRMLLLFGLLSASPSQAVVPVPSDVEVGLTAEPNRNLHSGDMIDFTLSVRNGGPEPISQLILLPSTNFVDEFDLHAVSTDCQNLATAIGDGDGYWYLYLWTPTEQAPLSVGETRSCHLYMALTSRMPAEFEFGLFLSDYYQDLDPGNDRATVILRRAVEPPAPVPARAAAALLLLATLLAAAARAARPSAAG